MNSTIIPGQFPYQAGQLLPQKPPMLLAHEFLAHDNGISRISAVLPEDGIFFDSHEGLLPEYFIEVTAQAVAATTGYEAVIAGNPVKQGLLVGVDEFFFLAEPPPSGTIEIKVQKSMGFGPIKIFSGMVSCKETVLTRGILKVWEEE
ncbi:MAG: ACP dehydratase [Thermodesulfobacteriota bacterium]